LSLPTAIATRLWLAHLAAAVCTIREQTGSVKRCSSGT